MRSLLIIDDNDADREWCTIVLNRTGRFDHVYEVSTAGAALELFKNYEASRAAEPERFPPIVILLDINMPAMDGFEFLEAFRPLQDQVRAQGALPSVVMMITSSTNQEDRQRARELGVRDFITKPLTDTQAVAIADQLGSP